MQTGHQQKITLHLAESRKTDKSDVGIMKIIPVKMLPKRPNPKFQTTTGKVDRYLNICHINMIESNPY
jgi:hypothetical protein